MVDTSDIDTMEASRELDALVATHVMDWEDPYLPHYSTDIAAAWQLLEKLRATYFVFLYCAPGNYGCQIWIDEEDPQPLTVASAKTAPLAICRAALKVVNLPIPP